MYIYIILGISSIHLSMDEFFHDVTGWELVSGNRPSWLNLNQLFSGELLSFSQINSQLCSMIYLCQCGTVWCEYGGFLKQGYPQFSSILGYPNSRKPPSISVHINSKYLQQQMICLCIPPGLILQPLPSALRMVLGGDISSSRDLGQLEVVARGIAGTGKSVKMSQNAY